jgi:hypothetical protein
MKIEIRNETGNEVYGDRERDPLVFGPSEVQGIGVDQPALPASFFRRERKAVSATIPKAINSEVLGSGTLKLTAVTPLTTSPMLPAITLTIPGPVTVKVVSPATPGPVWERNL